MRCWQKYPGNEHASTRHQESGKRMLGEAIAHESAALFIWRAHPSHDAASQVVCIKPFFQEGFRCVRTSIPHCAAAVLEPL